MIPTVETERLRLRGWREDDLDDFAAMAADEQVMRWLGSGPLDRADAWRGMAMFLGHWALRGHGFWVVEVKETGAFAGRVGLWSPEGWPGVEVGWALAREQWGRGYATEAGGAAVQWGFGELGLQRIICLVHPDNERSLKVAARLGLAHEGEAQVRQWRLLLHAAYRSRRANAAAAATPTIPT